jgi:NitT/TauT family transport system permease protein
MMSASTNLNMPLVFSGLLITAVMGIALYFIIDVVERRALHWAMR